MDKRIMTRDNEWMYWILKNCYHYDFYIETFFSTVKIFEACKVLRQENDDRYNMSCLCCVCMDIAYKLMEGDEDDEMYISSWIDISCHDFSREEFIEMQIEILRFLEYDLFKFSIDVIPSNANADNIIPYICSMINIKHDDLNLVNSLLRQYLIDQMILISSH